MKKIFLSILMDVHYFCFVITVMYANYLLRGVIAVPVFVK